MLGKTTKKSIQSVATFGVIMISVKLLTLMRHTLKLRYLGTGLHADIFTLFWKIPSLLGTQIIGNALIPAVVPALVTVLAQKDQDNANKLLSALLIIKLAVIGLLCLCILTYWDTIFLFLAPGMHTKIVALTQTTPIAPATVSFILILSISSCLMSGQQAKNDYLAKAWGRLLVSLSSITGLMFAVFFQLPVTACVLFLLCGGIAQLTFYIIRSWRAGYRLSLPTKQTLGSLANIFKKFSMYGTRATLIQATDLLEVRCASMLAPGCLAVFATILSIRACILYPLTTTVSTVLLPRLCQASLRSHKRLGFYLLESAKFLLWITLPLTLLLSFFSYSFFFTIFHQWLNSLSLEQTAEASHLFVLFAIGFFFSSLKQLLLTTFYALGSTTVPLCVSICGVIVRCSLIYLLMNSCGSIGFASALLCSTLAEIMLFLLFLPKSLNVLGYIKRFGFFAAHYGSLLAGISCIFVVTFELIKKMLWLFAPSYAPFMVSHLGLWLWVIPLSGSTVLVVNRISKLQKLKLYFGEET